jgi:hypothetical protein
MEYNFESIDYTATCLVGTISICSYQLIISYCSMFKMVQDFDADMVCSSQEDGVVVHLQNSFQLMS